VKKRERERENIVYFRCDVFQDDLSFTVRMRAAVNRHSGNNGETQNFYFLSSGHTCNYWGGGGGGVLL